MSDTQELTRIDSPLERRRVGDISVERFAGLTFREYREAIEFCKLVSQAVNGIPEYLRGNAADCLVITTQALRWKLEPVWCMQNSYIAKSGGLINYENFVFAAIVMASGVLRGRPRYFYQGEGDERTCTVSAVFHGEHEPHEYTTPPLKQCRPAKNQDGVVKGSPLWTRDPDQQMAYFAIRNWARRYIPELLGGVYSRDEFEDSTQDAVPPSPNLMERLPGKMGGAGFKLDIVDTGIAEEAAKAGESTKAKAKARSKAEPRASEVSEEPPPETAQEPERVPEPPGPPQRAEEYLGHVERWVAKVTDPDDLEARWEGERELRDSLKVPIAVRRRAETMFRARLDDLRK